MKALNNLKSYTDIAVLAIRLAFGIRLIYGTQDNVFSWARMVEFAHFLESFNFPLPLISAIVSVACQFIGGIIFILGFHTRIAALVILLNFTVALVTVHWQDAYLNLVSALHLWVISLFLLTYGPGKIALTPGK